MTTNFQNLLDDYVFLGRDTEHLSKDELFELTVAYLEHKFSKWPWGNCKASDSIEVPLTMDILYQLGSNIYNAQKSGLEKVKDAVIESYWDNVSEKLDDEIERAKNRAFIVDDYDCYEACTYRNPINSAILFNEIKKQGVLYGK